MEDEWQMVAISSPFLVSQNTGMFINFSMTICPITRAMDKHYINSKHLKVQKGLVVPILLHKISVIKIQSTINYLTKI